VKWAGGKGQILGELLKRVPDTYGTYYEPFVGGGALYFALSPARAVLNDKNPHLMNAYSVIRDDVESLIRKLAEHEAAYRQTVPQSAYYYRVRSLKPWSLPPVERASWLIFLNRTCYNGLWRVNSEGVFNVPFGRYKNPRILDEANLREISALLQSVTLRCVDFEEVLEGAQAGDFVYLDPPYDPVSDTSRFTNYVDEGFGPKDQERLAGVFEALSRRGVLAMLSNSDTPLIRRLYARYEPEVVCAKRPINCRGDRRGVINELVIRNYRGGAIGR
jgi:DNA adenine methylase